MSADDSLSLLGRDREGRSVVIGRSDSDLPCITICAGTGCVTGGASEVVEAFRDALADQGLSRKVEIRLTGCHGFCEMGPLVTLQPSDVFYPKVRPRDARAIVDRTILGNEPIEELLYRDPSTDEPIERESDIPFYRHQHRIVLAENGRIDPTNLSDYLSIGGYLALQNVLATMSPEDVIDHVTRAGLRGRGGAGFPAGPKWEIASRQQAELKYVVCNGDEGDPGAYMDRSVMEGNPHRVIEGMCIGAYAIGAQQGFVYVRHEYPLAVERISRAARDARRSGMLGKRILGTDFTFNVEVVRGAGAFVCGEETALIASIEGHKGEPRQRPPYPAIAGYNGCPTLINNVETWANVPHIINNGPDWYASLGSGSSKGTKIFSLVGKVNCTGLVEVPMGTSIRSIVYDIGGGIPGGKSLKAVQTGGPAGGCLPADMVDMPIDFEALREAGTIMGSGGLIVMDESTCMVDVARYFTCFLEEESCGKCYPCRKGTQRMRELLEDICEGRGTMEHLKLLEELGAMVNTTSLCGLGQNAATPVLSTIRYFREEYRAHIEDRCCPAGVCTELIRYEIASDLCDGCDACRKVCPAEAIVGEKDEVHTIDTSQCIKCGTCQDVCAKDAVIVLSGGGHEH